MKVKAIILSKGEAKLGEVDVAKPSRGEILVKTKTCGICSGDFYVFQGKLHSHGIAGHEGAGIVDEVGEEVKNVRRGDKVTTLGIPAFAEYHKTDYQRIARIPDNVEDFSCWISEPLACVVNAIRGSGIQIGDNVSIIGCGYMGLLLIQAMLKTILNNLVAIDIIDDRLVLAKKFDAEFTINPKIVDFSEEIRSIFNGETDIVFEASGASGTLDKATEFVRLGRTLVISGRHVLSETVPTEDWHAKGLKILNTAPNFSTNFLKDFHDAVKLLKKGVFDQRQLITHKFPCESSQIAFETASKKTVDYIKGVMTF